MKNNKGVKITQHERKYFNQLKKSISRLSKGVETTLSKYQKPTYLRNTKTAFTPIIKKTRINNFTSRKEFVNELKKLIETKQSLSTYKIRKPKFIDELPKRVQQTIEKTQAIKQGTRINVAKQIKTKTIKQTNIKQQNLYRLLSKSYIMKKNLTYRANMISAIKQTFPSAIAKELINGLKSMNETQFLSFYLSRDTETIAFIYYNPNDLPSKYLELSRDILNALENKI